MSVHLWITKEMHSSSTLKSPILMVLCATSLRPSTAPTKILIANAKSGKLVSTDMNVSLTARLTLIARTMSIVIILTVETETAYQDAEMETIVEDVVPVPITSAMSQSAAQTMTVLMEFA